MSVFYSRPAGGRRPKPYTGGAGRAARTTVGDANYTIKSWDRVVVLTSVLTAPRTWTFPLANSVPQGYTITGGDSVGGVTVTNFLTLAAGGTDGLLGSTGIMDRQYGSFMATSDGSGLWYIDPLWTGTFNGSVTFNGSILAANFRDSATTFYDNADSSKQLQFQCNGITTGTIRALTAPDRNGVIVTETLIQQSAPNTALGYQAGAGGTVTQATSKSTAVSLNTPSGRITMNNAALAASTTVSFTLNNSRIDATCTVGVNHRSGGTLGAYRVDAYGMTTGAVTIAVTNLTGGSLSEAIVLNYNVISGATA